MNARPNAGTKPESVTKQDLAIPDTYCSWTESKGHLSASPNPNEHLYHPNLNPRSNLSALSPVTSGHACPANMDCIPLKLEWHGFAGFDNFSAPNPSSLLIVHVQCLYQRIVRGQWPVGQWVIAGLVSSCEV